MIIETLPSVKNKVDEDDIFGSVIIGFYGIDFSRSGSPMPILHCYVQLLYFQLLDCLSA